MKAIFAALAIAALVSGAIEAQSTAQQRINPPPNTGFPGTQTGGPNHQGSPGIMPNHLAMKPNGEIESVGPNRRDWDNSHFSGPASGDRPRGNFAADRQIHTDQWSSPASAQPRRWTAGEHLAPASYAPSQQITRFNLYGLTTPLPNTVWVRNGPDALLVNRTNGEIVRAQYGVFK